MLTPHHGTGLRALPFLVASLLLFFLWIALVQSTRAARAAVPALPPAEAPSEASSAEVSGSPVDIPSCDPDWIAVPSPNPGTGLATLSGVATVATDDVWAVGYYENSSRYQTLVLHWDGSAWSAVPSPNPGPSNNYLNGVTAVAADDVWAVGYYADGTGASQNLILHWDGSVWSVVPSPGVESSFNLLSTVDAISANDVWTVGYYVQNGRSHPLTLHWDGTQWSLIPSPDVGTRNTLLRGVTAITSNDVWAVGLHSDASDDYQTLTMHWDGSAWSVVPSPNVGTENNHLFSVDAVSANDIWAVGHYYVGGLGQTLILHGNGSTWSVVPSPDPGIDHMLRAVAAASANDVWAVGNYDDNSSNNQILLLHWNGSAWRVSSGSTVGSTANELYGVAVLSTSVAWAVGDYSSSGDEQPLVVRYEPCPATHTPTPGTPLPTHTATPTATRTQLAGTPTPVPTQCLPQWTVVDSPDVDTSDNQLRGVAAISANDIWAVGYYGNNQQGFRTLTMHWDGSAWSVVSSPNVGSYINFLQGITAISSSDVWAVGYWRNGGLGDFENTLTIHWDGTSWSQVYSPDPDPQRNRLLGVTAISSSDVWAVGFYQDYNGIEEVNHSITLHWDGSAWSVVPSPSPSAYTYLYAVTGTSSNDVWAVGLYHTTNDFALAMHWDGSSWDVVAMPNMGTGENDLYAVTAVSADDVWAVGKYVQYGGPYQLDYTLTEHWDGSAWNIVASPSPGSESNWLNAAVALSTGDVWAVGEYHDLYGVDQPLTEHWDGSAWSVVPSPPAGGLNWLLGVTAISSNDVWAVGLHGNPYRTLIEHYRTPCGTPTPVGTSTPTQTATGSPTNTPAATGTAPTTASVTATTEATATNSPPPTITPGLPTQTVTVPPLPATATPAGCTRQFTDVPPGTTFYPYIMCLACRGIISGYSDGSFRPGNNVTRGQAAKIIANSADYQDPIPPDRQTFNDVAPGSTFWLYIERVALHGAVSGYECGGQGEPCPGMYFRAGNNLTRGQQAKIDSEAFGYSDPIPPDRQTFNDVPPGSTFWLHVERLALHSVISGYRCGGEGEPCPGAYYRPANNITRGQVSKVVANTFFPQCQPSRLR